jgi:hypothetical protein
MSFWQMFKAGFAFAFGTFAFAWMLALAAGLWTVAVKVTQSSSLLPILTDLTAPVC